MSQCIAAVSQAATQQRLLLEEGDNNMKLAQTNISTTAEVLHSILEVREDALLHQVLETGESISTDLRASYEKLAKLLCQLNGYLSCVENNFTTSSEVELLSTKESMRKYSSQLLDTYEYLMERNVVENNCYLHVVFLPRNMSETLSSFGKVEVSECGSEGLYEVEPWFKEPTLSLKLSVQRQSSPLHAFNDLKSPTSIAISHRGEIVVAEGRRDQVTIISPVSGKVVNSFGQCGSEEGDLRFPCGVAIDNKGNILVVDGGNNRIQMYSPRGKFIAEAGGQGRGQLQFCEPEGIATNPVNRKIYIVDNNSHRIQVLKEDLSFDFSFGSDGLLDGYLYYPWGIACGRDGNVFVTDSGSCCVKVFTSSGQFLSEFGGEGDVDGCLKWPTGICLSQNETVYVSEYGNNRISVFTTEGRFLHKFGAKGKDLNEFGNVRGLAMDENGLLYVCDTDNNRVIMY